MTTNSKQQQPRRNIYKAEETKNKNLKSVSQFAMVAQIKPISFCFDKKNCYG